MVVTPVAANHKREVETMKVVFLGVGESFDEDYVNNSHLIVSETKLLLDCGYAIPRHFWKHYPDKDLLDALYLSHRHADHCFGMPILLLRMAEERRQKPLTIICQKGMKEDMLAITEYAYSGIFDRLPFQVQFIEVTKDDRVQLNELELEFAPSTHVISNFAIRVSSRGNVVCYSGDGTFNEATRQLYRNADLLIHESYYFDKRTQAHASLIEVIDMAREVGVKCLALTHLSRDLRREKHRVLEHIKRQEDIKVLLPEPLQEYNL